MAEIFKNVIFRRTPKFLGDKFETIHEKQSELELRVAKLTRQQASAPLSKAERLAGQELRNTDRQLAHFRKSIVRAKMMSTEFKRQHEKSIEQVRVLKVLKIFEKKV